MNSLQRISKAKGRESRTSSHRSRMMFSRFFHFAFSILIFLVAGCQKNNEKAELIVQMEQLTQQNEQLQEQIDQTKTENKELQKRVQVLSALPGDARVENLYSVQQIKIGRLSGFFDKDKDGKREKIIVYITPVDKQGDGIKAAGTANVQLWDLNKTNGEALLGEWDVEPDKLKKAWFKTVLAVNYRLAFDIPDTVKSFDEQLTVRITFTDYLSGRVFKEQKVIQPR